MSSETERQQSSVLLVAPIVLAIIGAALGTRLGLSPVGIREADIFWAGALGALVGLVVPRAPLWIVTGAALSTLGFAASTVAAALSTAVLFIAFFWRRKTRWSSSMLDASRKSGSIGQVLAVLVAASLFTATLMLHDHGREFSSAVLSGAIWTAMSAAVWIRLPKTTRRITAGVTALASIAIAAAATGAALQLQDVYKDAINVEGKVRTALQAARAVDVGTATQAIGEANRLVEGAEEITSAPLLTAWKYTPIVGPNLQVLGDGLSAATQLIRSTEEASDIANDFDKIISDDGLAFDEVERLAVAIDTALHDVQELRGTLRQERGVWVLQPVEDALREAADRTAPIEEFREISLAESARRLLGGDDPRTYLVLLANTAEARELGGFAGATAVITVDDGTISLDRADRPGELNDKATDPSVFASAPPQRFLEHRPWLYSQNYTAMIDFSTLADFLAALYPNMGGEEIDGVVYLDPSALSAILGLVGEVHLEAADLTVDSGSIAHLVNVAQYEQFDEQSDRELFLSELIASTFDELLSAGADLQLDNLPALLEAVRQDRLLFVPFDDTEYELAQLMNLVGTIPEPEGQDFLAVSHLNGSPNKLDAYLHRSISYEVNIDPATGELDAIVEITLRNDAPEGLSSYASGNAQGNPHGTNRAVIVVHTPHDAVQWTGGDEPEFERSWNEFGWQRHEHVLLVPRGQERTVTLELEGRISPGEYRLDIGHQPLVNNDSLRLEIHPASGELTSDDPRFSATPGGLVADLTLTHDTRLSAVWIEQPAN